MDQSNPMSAPMPLRREGGLSRVATGPALSVVTSPLRLAQPAEPPPKGWEPALAMLLDWLDIQAEIVSEARSHRLPRMTGWARAAVGVGDPPVFAPWIGWSPTALQHGGLATLPQAQFTMSYCIDHPRGSQAGRGGVDLVLVSPHPALCNAEEAGAVPSPRRGVLRAMIRRARGEGRERLAIILHARQRNAVARQLMVEGKSLTRDGLALDILTIEEALAPLMSGNAPWDAIIAMPDLRSTVFMLLAESSGVRGGWPMLWCSGKGGNDATLITAETPGEGASRLPLDAPALILSFALALREAGARQAAARLHEAWAQLRDSGVTTAARGAAAPYVTVLPDAEFIARLCAGKAVSKRPQPTWRALGEMPRTTADGRSPGLRLVASNPVGPSLS